VRGGLLRGTHLFGPALALVTVSTVQAPVKTSSPHGLTVEPDYL
jgi:hypothetical protein